MERTKESPTIYNKQHPQNRLLAKPIICSVDFEDVHLLSLTVVASRSLAGREINGPPLPKFRLVSFVDLRRRGNNNNYRLKKFSHRYNRYGLRGCLFHALLLDNKKSTNSRKIYVIRNEGF
jgi:hypothetical protein